VQNYKPTRENLISDYAIGKNGKLLRLKTSMPEIRLKPITRKEIKTSLVWSEFKPIFLQLENHVENTKENKFVKGEHIDLMRIIAMEIGLNIESINFYEENFNTVNKKKIFLTESVLHLPRNSLEGLFLWYLCSEHNKGDERMITYAQGITEFMVYLKDIFYKTDKEKEYEHTNILHIAYAYGIVAQGLSFIISNNIFAKNPQTHNIFFGYEEYILQECKYTNKKMLEFRKRYF
jgi:hypothetical protein